MLYAHDVDHMMQMFDCIADCSRSICTQEATIQTNLYDTSFTGNSFQLLIRQILDANVRIDTGRGKRFLGTSTTNTKDVGEGDLDALLIGDVDSGKTCHCDSFCFPQVLHRVVRFPGPGLRTRGSSRFHGL